MSYTFKHIGAVALRALRQLLHDRRFLALSLVGPVLIIYFLKLFFDTLESPVFKPTQFIVPIGAFIVHFITYLLCSIVLVRERTAQTLSRMFVNGYQQVEIISGYLLAYTFLATLQSLLVLSELSLLFNLGYSLGTLLSIYLIIWLLAIISIALGIFVSNFARSEAQVLPFIPLVILLSVFLSGLLIPIDKLPDWAQWLSHLIPVYYANQVVQHLIKPGGAIGDDWGNFIGLPVYGVIILSLATLTLREQD
jgi:ABC-2 type transport system permease protein